MKFVGKKVYCCWEPVGLRAAQAKNQMSEGRICRIRSVNIGILTKKPVNYAPLR